MSSQHRPTRWAKVALAAAAALGILGACGDDTGTVTSTGTGTGTATGSASGPAHAPGSASAPATTAFDQSQATTAAEYTLVDYSFQGPLAVKGPRVYMTAKNEGSQDHELEVLNRERQPVGEIPAFAPNATSQPLAVELQPGQYTLQCLVETPDGRVHKDLGMVATLTVE